MIDDLDKRIGADPIVAIRLAGELYRKAPDAIRRRDAAILQIEAIRVLLLSPSDGSKSHLSNDDIAPLVAIAGGLLDLRKGIVSDVLNPATIGGKPSETATTIEDRKAAILAARAALIVLGVPAPEASARVARAVNLTQTNIENYAKNRVELESNLTYSLFADAVRDGSEDVVIAELKRFMLLQPERFSR